MAKQNKDLRKPQGKRDYDNSFVHLGEIKVPNEVYGQGDQSELGDDIQAPKDLPAHEL